MNTGRMKQLIITVAAMAALACLPARIWAWEPNGADLDAAIKSGDFNRYVTDLTAWLNLKAPASPAALTDKSMAALFRQPTLAAALAQRQFITKVGADKLGAFAKAAPANQAFLTWVLRSTEAMENALEGATPVTLGPRNDNSWGFPVSALELWNRISQADPESRTGVCLRLAIATGLNPPGTGNRGAGQAEKPAEPLARYNHFKSAYRNGELFPSFAKLTVWDLRQIVSSNASDEDLAWGRAMVNTWCPQLKAGQKVVDTTGYVWRRNSPIPHAGTFKNVMAGGGKCGPRSSWAVFICQAWGIPAIGLAQPAHAAVGYKDVDGHWKTAYGRSWAASRTSWGGGNEFVQGMEQRIQVEKFMFVERMRWLASALNPKERSDAILAIGQAIGRTPVELEAFEWMPLTTKPDETVALKSFEAPSNTGDNYTARVHGFVYPPVTGDYVFGVASDDHSDLFLSKDEDPANRLNISWVRGYTGPKGFDGQKSPPIRLEAGKRYYICALHREYDVGDHLSVGWNGGNGTKLDVIPGANLSPYPAGAKGSIVRELWRYRPVPAAAPKAPAPPKTLPEAPIRTEPGVIHIEAESFVSDGGITIWGGHPGVPVYDCTTGGKQAFFQGALASAWAGYKINVPATGLYELTVRAAAVNQGQGLYVRSFGAMAPIQKATASHVHRNNTAGLGPQFLIDNNPGTRWAANEGNDRAWLEFDLGKPTKINTVMIDERAYNRISKFSLSYKVNNDWKVIFEGTNIGIDFTKDFDPVTAQQVRLDIFDTREGMGYGPTLWEFSLGTAHDGRAWVQIPWSYGLWQTTKPTDISLVKGEQTLWVFAPFQRGVAVRWLELKPSSGANRTSQPVQRIQTTVEKEDDQ